MALTARRMPPKTRLHLFMTRTLVILRLNYSGRVKMNSNAGFFLLSLCLLKPNSAADESGPEHPTHWFRERSRFCRAVGGKEQTDVQSGTEWHAYSVYVLIEAFSTKPQSTLQEWEAKERRVRRWWGGGCLVLTDKASTHGGKMLLTVHLALVKWEGTLDRWTLFPPMALQGVCVCVWSVTEFL